jgi:acyl-coenzyme A synthetase/AMP-(fatty) acid ligase
MVKRRGYRIELNEIEGCLYRHPAIAGVAVIAAPNAESGMQIIAYVVANNGAQLSVIEMKRFCSQHLPAYMNPDFFVFVDALPRTSTAKTDYQMLIRRFEAGTAKSGVSVAHAG